MPRPQPKIQKMAVNLRIPADELAEIKRLASDNGCTFTEWMIRMALQKGKR